MDLGIAAGAAAVGIGTLLLGAAWGWFWNVPRRVVAGVMAFGAGVMVATLALELVAEAADGGGVWPVVAGFAGGAVLYVAGDRVIAMRARRRARRAAVDDGSRNITARRGGDTPGNGGAIAVGALLDGVPEAMVIGLSAASGFPVAIVAAIGLSNVPEGLAGTVALKRSGRPGWQIFVLWGGITAIATVAAVVGAAALADARPEMLAAMVALAAGALMAMVCNAMIPEAFEEDHWATGLLAAAGFLVAFVLNELT
ncbi:ZIP family zinc transporter [Demequina sp. B12]|uniref:ZIP family metal transporter n=1 Tax=Demequina sp. B12 TaxID=2992757 RepID=UPI00237C1231|nr:ZIP family zinc transporter [Demequina sp. B12]MDE0573372.1 ZIP family zinc transporter [Demequina sp. B12]